MGEVIEHGEDPDEVVRVEGYEPRVPVSLYQAVYHQITGRTEEITKRYDDNLLISFRDIEELNTKIEQINGVHTVVASNQTVTLFQEGDRKQQFTSFDRFRRYNSNTSSPSTVLVLKYDFSIRPSSSERTQSYVITIKLFSRIGVATAIKQADNMHNLIIAAITDSVAEIKVEYADYVIARTFLEAMDDWVNGCDSNPKNRIIRWGKRNSHFFSPVLRVAAAFLIIVFAYKSIPDFFSSPGEPSVFAKFAVIYFGALHLFMAAGAGIGRMSERLVDNYIELSYLDLTKGDSILRKRHEESTRKTIFKLSLNAIYILILGLLSSWLSALI
jgi:hypothetical protein